jgi:hypothetical protein
MYILRIKNSFLVVKTKSILKTGFLMIYAKN